MAEPKVTDAKTPASTQADKPTQTDTKKDSAVTATQSQKPLYTDQKFWLPIVAVVLGILLLSMAFVAGHRTALRDYEHGYRAPFMGMGGAYDRGYMMPRDGDMMHEYGTTDNTSNTRVSGVVMAVDGDTLTVAGNGTTTKVAVSSNTAYSGSTNPAQVNDSIIVVGAKGSDGTLVASSVRLIRQ